MTHADPWDEIVRLEKQMDAELLARLEEVRKTVSRVRRPGDKKSGERGETARPD